MQPEIKYICFEISTVLIFVCNLMNFSDVIVNLSRFVHISFPIEQRNDGVLCLWSEGLFMVVCLSACYCAVF